MPSLSTDLRESELDADDIDMSSLDAAPLEAKGGAMARRSLQLGKKLISGAVQVAKAKSQAVAQKRSSQKLIQDGTTKQNEPTEFTDANETFRNVSATVGETSVPVATASVRHTSPSDEPMQATFSPVSSRFDEEHGEGEKIQQQFDNTPGPKLGQQLRGRFSGLRQVTKNKLGSAVQAAKQKGLEVAEKRLQQWRHQGEETTQHHAPASVHIDQHVSSSNQAFEPSSVSLQATDSPLSWSCGICTFLNAGQLQVCEVCGGGRESSNPDLVAPTVATMDASSVRQAEEDEIVQALPGSQHGISTGHGTVASGDVDEESIISDLASEDGEKGRRRMRDRLGAAVRSVRSIALPKDAEGANKVRLGANNDPFSPSAGLAQAVKLRGISIGKELSVDDLNVKNTPFEIPLKKLEGQWIAHVALPRHESAAIQTQSNGVHEVEASGTQTSSSLTERGQTAATMDPAQVSTGATEALEGMTIGDLSTGLDPFKPDFLVQLFKQDVRLDLDKSLFLEIQRSFADVYALHTAVSEAVGDYVLHSSVIEPERDSTRLEMGVGLASRLGLSPLDTIRFTGKMLAGILEAPKDLAIIDWERYKCKSVGATIWAFFPFLFCLPHSNVLLHVTLCAYHVVAAVIKGAVVTDFLQSILDSPLPINALAALEDFLQLGSIHVENAGTAVNSELPPTEALVSPEPTTGSSLIANSRFVERNYETLLSNAAREMLAMSSVCQTQLHRLEMDAQLSNHNLASSSQPTSRQGHRLPTSLPTIHEPLLPASVMEDLHEAMHTALMKVMAERDEAHAQLIAANVLHVHEMEQERKKTDHLAKQLEVSQKLLKSANGGPLNFGGNNNNDNEKPEANLKRYQDQMTQNVEAELLSLCQQLAGEISARTAAELEIIRLKESRKLERDGEMAEKQALRNELKRVKDIAAAVSKNDL
jgi:hypothetical protein